MRAIGRLAARPAAAGLAAALAGAFAFFPALGHGWVHDDHTLIEHSSAVVGAVSLPRLFAQPFWPPGLSLDKLYRPVTVLSYRLNTLAGPTPWPDFFSFHVVNLALHANVNSSEATGAVRNRPSGRQLP